MPTDPQDLLPEEREAQEAEAFPGREQGRSPDSSSQEQEAVWTFRGYRLRPSEFTTAMVHFFRAEVTRANVWRQRLDATTNWAVITTGAVISFAFTESQSPHLVIALNLLLVTFFLSIESRRYRYYELWSYRVRLMETDFFAPMLVPPFHPSPDWAEALAENLLHPHYPISSFEAIGRRLRRNYLWIYATIGLAWVAKLWLQPEPSRTWNEFVQRAAVGGIAGEVILFIVLGFTLLVLLFSVLTVGLQEATGEILPRYEAISEQMLAGVLGEAGEKEPKRAWYRRSHKRRQLLTFIITDQPKPVAEHILRDMNRGATSLAGTGMYTGKAHTVLMIALTVSEIPTLKSLVNRVDPNAFVIVSPAQEIFGTGFMPLSSSG
jgi:uncharacterized membrane protein